MEKPVILMIADISGYTGFVTRNVETAAHSQAVIRELIETLIQQVEIPLVTAKLEGDAVFFYAVKEDSETMTWTEKRAKIEQKLLIFFEAFSRKLVQLSASNLCDCDACRNITNLKLKLIVHSGTAFFQRIGNFDELGGLDAIIVHRLLKNSIGSDEYLLFTEAAQKSLKLPNGARAEKRREKYNDIGTINVCVYFPGPAISRPLDTLRKEYNAVPLKVRFANAGKWGQNVVSHTLLLLLHLRKPQEGVGIAADYDLLQGIARALGIILLFPIMFFINGYKVYQKLAKAK